MERIERAADLRTVLGEGPLWRGSEQRLYWLDLRGPNIFRFDPVTGRNETLRAALPSGLGGLVFDRQGRWIVVDDAGIHRLDPASGSRTSLGNPEAGRPENSFNDAKVDRSGRLWTGSCNRDWVTPTGSFYMMGTDGEVTVIDRAVACANGPAFSPDGGRAYWTDSPTREIFCYDIDPATGAVGPRRSFHKFGDVPEQPDGMTVDADGCLWVALWDAWCVAQIRPDGRLERRVKLPVPQPSSVAFGGERLDRLFVTTASLGLSEAQLREAPLSGHLLVAEVGARGLPEPDYGG
jgi:sugar lactone lactonase YvrE